jgi:hypothetical protein
MTRTNAALKSLHEQKTTMAFNPTAALEPFQPLSTLPLLDLRSDLMSAFEAHL